MAGQQLLTFSLQNGTERGRWTCTAPGSLPASSVPLHPLLQHLLLPPLLSHCRQLEQAYVDKGEPVSKVGALLGLAADPLHP